MDISTDKYKSPRIDLEECRRKFVDSFDLILRELSKDSQKRRAPEMFKKYLVKMFNHSLLGGKMTRGCLVVLSARLLFKRDLTEEEEMSTIILGWCVEMLQGLFLILDDIMDNSITRRGKPCWYKMEGVGLSAINDSVICNAFLCNIITKYFHDKPYYTKILELFFDITLSTGYGQGVDILTAPSGKLNFHELTEERYNYIVEYKTAYYSFCLPVFLGMHVTGIVDQTAFDKAKEILIEIGKLYQVQDDFIDCYGDPDKTGKVGTDIQDNKCSWLIIQAIEHSSPEQRERLQEYYGKDDPECIQKVVDVYNEIGLKDIYEKFEGEKIAQIGKLIGGIGCIGVSKELFFLIMDIIGGRKA